MKNLHRLPAAACLLVLALGGIGCTRKEEPVPVPPAPQPPPPQAGADTHQPAPLPLSDAARPEPDSAPLPDAREADVLPAPAPGPVDPPSLAGLAWKVTPETLDVMRDTVVKLEVTWTDVPEADFQCRWDPGDNSGTKTGCRAEHRFVGGLADRVVNLTVSYRGSEVFSARQALPLERLPVRELPAETSSLPPHPEDEGALRLLLLPLFAQPDDAGVSVLKAAAEASAADIVVAFFNVEVSPEASRVLLDALGGGGRRRAVPMYCGGGPSGLPAGDALDLLAHGPGAELPYRAGLLAGSALLVLMDSRRTGVVIDEEKWLLEQLELGKVAAHRIVLSCRPFEPITARQTTELAPRYRFYEKMLRGDASLLVTTGHAAWFSGAYGQIPVLFPGCATGQPEPLLGSPDAQPRTASIVDLVPGAPPRIRALSPERPQDSLELVFPGKVGSYERRK